MEVGILYWKSIGGEITETINFDENVLESTPNAGGGQYLVTVAPRPGHEGNKEQCVKSSTLKQSNLHSWRAAVTPQ